MGPKTPAGGVAYFPQKGTIDIRQIEIIQYPKMERVYEEYNRRNYEKFIEHIFMHRPNNPNNGLGYAQQ